MYASIQESYFQMFSRQVIKRRLPSLSKLQNDKFSVSGLNANLAIDAKGFGNSGIKINCLDLIENPSADVAFIKTLDAERKTKIRYKFLWKYLHSL